MKDDKPITISDDGFAKCNICGKTFKAATLDKTKLSAYHHVTREHDIVQNIKTATVIMNNPLRSKNVCHPSNADRIMKALPHKKVFPGA